MICQGVMLTTGEHSTGWITGRTGMSWNSTRRSTSPAPEEELSHTSVYLAATQLESSATEKNMGILNDTELNMNMPCAFTARNSNCILGCITENIATDLRELRLPFYSVPLRHRGSVVPGAGLLTTRQPWVCWKRNKDVR